MSRLPMNNPNALRARGKALNLYGLLANWDEAATAGWIQRLLDWEADPDF